MNHISVIVICAAKIIDRLITILRRETEAADALGTIGAQQQQDACTY